MGEFCSVWDVRLALAPDADSAGNETAASLKDWQIEDAIDEAEGRINAYVASRYSIVTFEIEVENPNNIGETWVFMVAPSPVRGWTRDVAAYLATLTFRKGKDLEERDPIQLRYDATMRDLVAVRDGKIDLQLPNPEGTTAGEVAVYNQYEGQLFPTQDGFNAVADVSQGRRPQVLWPAHPFEV